MQSTEIDERFMRAALREARKGLGHTSPNPAVGAVLVASGKIIARGHHRQAGAPHAEIECLQSAGGSLPAKSTLYVTLEPCSTAGRTGACIDEIIRAGIKTVVIGATDPNPRHQGRGAKLLEEAGLTVRSGVLADKCGVLNEAFNKWIVTGQPFVVAKCGMSLDGRLTRRPGEPRWMTDPIARRHANVLRASVDAVLVGAETVRADNPQLTARHGQNLRQPLRVVLTRSGNFPRQTRLFTGPMAKRTIVYEDKSLRAVLGDLGRKNITSVVIEGGGNVLGQALDGQLIDKIQIYLGPILTGGLVIAFPGRGTGTTATAPRLERVTYRRLGQNVCVTGYPKFGGITPVE
ncbi:MAG: bifunctional diaminohydroxyphosphoribosylaminopyrimidine deaminase/5-amino-6-(5-phosphoribosylamino)uracil reductase RibD [Verrucomicrobiota bacterium]